jgi:hypothetical protein
MLPKDGQVGQNMLQTILNFWHQQASYPWYTFNSMYFMLHHDGMS